MGYRVFFLWAQRGAQTITCPGSFVVGQSPAVARYHGIIVTQKMALTHTLQTASPV